MMVREKDVGLAFAFIRSRMMSLQKSLMAQRASILITNTDVFVRRTRLNQTLMCVRVPASVTDDRRDTAFVLRRRPPRSLSKRLILETKVMGRSPEKKRLKTGSSLKTRPLTQKPVKPLLSVCFTLFLSARPSFLKFIFYFALGF